MADVAPGAEGGMSGGMGGQVNLTAAKEARKRTELDAQLLANRIALLKQEEEKAWKKIEETRKRANEIMELRKQNEQKFAAKEHFYKAKWDSIRAAQARNQQQREKAKAIKDQTRQGILEQRTQNAKAGKEQSMRILNEKKERESSEKQANMERSAYLKSRREEATRKLEERRLQQLESYREDYEARTAQEELLRQRTDALVAKMEKEEMELIQRLQNTQTIQRTAYEELENALGQTSQQISTNSRPAAGNGKQPLPAA